jgi:hypothetical protein
MLENVHIAGYNIYVLYAECGKGTGRCKGCQGGPRPVSGRAFTRKVLRCELMEI